ncbi:FixH family protein [Alicyclobacillus herbarius]|uniref:FixH family protein n=1 Tax=Alicyclobacillus herbarius TaxID=122960 RepID=UPI00138AB1BB|nr:FixH family protein [Alicyclobacillus herbarius]
MMVTMTLLTGCGQVQTVSQSQAKQHMEQMQSLPEVALHLQGKHGLQAGQKVTLSVTVTQDGKPINDADMVEFEVWQQGAPANKHHFLTAKHTGNGVYSAEWTPSTGGAWNVMYHVTARGTHVMEPTRVQIKEGASHG